MAREKSADREARIAREQEEQKERERKALEENKILRADLEEATREAAIRFGGDLEILASDYSSDCLKILDEISKKFPMIEAAIVLTDKHLSDQRDCGYKVRAYVKSYEFRQETYAQYVESQNNAIRKTITDISKIEKSLRDDIKNFASAFVAGINSTNKEVQKLKEEISGLKRKLEDKEYGGRGFGPMLMMAPPWFGR